jgi:transketolase
MSKMATREAYGIALAELIKENDKVVVLDADLTKSTKTCDAKKARPEHHFNMGIAEGNMMGVAAGLAVSGKIVYASSFAMFAAGRAYEQVRNSIGYPHLNVKICATHAGITVGEDGASHQSIEDIALMRVIPGMHVFQPCDARETKQVIKAVADIEGPCYVRLGRLAVEDVHDENYTFVPGKADVLHEGNNIAIIASGLMVQEVLKAKEKLNNINPTIINMPTIKPLDEELLLKTAQTHDIILTCEEHSVIGGLGSAVCEYLSAYNLCKVIRVGIQDSFGESGTPQALLEKYGLSADKLADFIGELL